MKRTPYIHRGFTLVEMIIYITVLAFILVVVVNTLLSFVGGNRALGALRALDHSATESLERMSRDIRSASSVDVGNSILGSSPGALTLISSGGATTTRFYIQDGILKLDVNGVYYGPLTTNNVTVTDLTFYQLSNPVSKAVKVDMTLRAVNGPVTETRSYHTTIVLKES